MKRFYIVEESDSERGKYFSAYEFKGLDEFKEEQWDYVEGTMSFTKAEAIQALKHERGNATEKDIEFFVGNK